MKHPAAEDQNMFVCCMFLELGLKLSWTWTVIELFLNLLSWSSCSSVFSVFVRSCGLVCRVAFWCACPFSSVTCCLVFMNWLFKICRGKLNAKEAQTCSIGRSCKGHAIWCNYVVINVYQAHISALTKAVQSSATRCFGLITKGLEDNTTEELPEPWSSEAKIPSWKTFEKQIWNAVSVCFGLCLNDPSLRGLGS